MITHDITEDGCPSYHDGDCWIEVGGERNTGETVLYHHCPVGDNKVNDVLLVAETYNRKCERCGPVVFTDDLWTLYILLGGRGLRADETELEI